MASSNYATQELKNAISSWVFLSSTDAAKINKKIHPRQRVRNVSHVTRQLH